MARTTIPSQLITDADSGVGIQPKDIESNSAGLSKVSGGVMSVDGDWINTKGIRAGKLGDGSAPLGLFGGGTDHVYMEFFPDAEDQANKSGWIGYGVPGTTQMTISNEVGDLYFKATGEVKFENNIVMTDGTTIDGVDISAHVADSSLHSTMSTKEMAKPSRHESPSSISNTYYQLTGKVYVGESTSDNPNGLVALYDVDGNELNIAVSDITSDSAGTNSVIGSTWHTDPYIQLSSAPGVVTLFKFGTYTTLGTMPINALMTEGVITGEVDADVQSALSEIKGSSYAWNDAPPATLEGLNSSLSGKLNNTTDTFNGQLTISSGPLVLGRNSGVASIKSNSETGGWLIMDSEANGASINHYSQNNVYIANGGGNVRIGSGYTSGADEQLVVNGNTKILSGNDLILSTGNIINELDPGGGWARGYFYKNENGTTLGGFGASGNQDVDGITTLEKWYIGSGYENAALEIYKDDKRTKFYGNLILRAKGTADSTAVYDSNYIKLVASSFDEDNSQEHKLNAKIRNVGISDSAYQANSFQITNHLDQSMFSFTSTFKDGAATLRENHVNIGINKNNTSFNKSTVHIYGDTTIKNGVFRAEHTRDWDGSGNQETAYMYWSGTDLNMVAPHRGSGGRAIVHNGGNELYINYFGDFTGGTQIGPQIWLGTQSTETSTIGTSLTVNNKLTASTQLTVEGDMGDTDSRNFKVTYPSGGQLANTEFSALSHMYTEIGENNWTAMYAKQGSAEYAAVIDGDTKIVGGGGITFDGIGAGKILFKSKANPDSDWGFIEYWDDATSFKSGIYDIDSSNSENSTLFIGVENDLGSNSGDQVVIQSGRRLVIDANSNTSGTQNAKNIAEFWNEGKHISSIDPSGRLMIGTNMSPTEGIIIEGWPGYVSGAITKDQAGGRIFFKEDSTHDTYGVSLAYNGSNETQKGIPANQWALVRHYNSTDGSKVMYGSRNSSTVYFTGAISASGNISSNSDISATNIKATDVKIGDNEDSVWHAGNFNPSNKADKTKTDKDLITAGWYRIASIGDVASGAGGDNLRAHARFTVSETRSGHHSAMSFYASVHFGKKPTLTLLNRSYYGNNGAIKKVRIVHGGIYEGAAVEVYYDSGGNPARLESVMYENEQYTGWVAEDFTPGSVPTGFSTTALNPDTTDAVFTVTGDGNDDAFYARRDGTISCNDIYLGSTDTQEGNIHKVDGIYGANDIRFGIGSTLHHYMNSTGLNLGENTAPTDVLEVNGAIQISKSTTIGGTTFDNGHLKIGSSAEGIALDSNEIVFFGSEGHINTANAKNLYIGTNGNRNVIIENSDGAVVIPSGIRQSQSGAPSGWIWSISNDYPNYGIYYNDDTEDTIDFMWNGIAKASINLTTGGANFADTDTNHLDVVSDSGIDIIHSNGQGNNIYTNSDGQLVLASQASSYNNHTDRITIDDETGNVGIGTTPSGYYKLYTNGSAAVKDTLFISDRNAVTGGSSGVRVDLFVGDGQGNGGGRLFFKEDNASDAYGLSLLFNGTGIDQHGVTANKWGLVRHNNDSTGSVIMSGNRTDSNVNFKGDIHVSGAKIGMGNDTAIIEFHDSNPSTRANYWDGLDVLSLRGDSNAENNVVVRTGHVQVNKNMHVEEKVGIGNFELEYDSTSESLKFNFIG